MLKNEEKKSQMEIDSEVSSEKIIVNNFAYTRVRKYREALNEIFNTERSASEVASQMIVSGSFDDIEVAKNISEYLLPKTKDGKPGKRIDIYLEARALRVVAAMQDACSKYFEKRPNKHETVTAMLSVGNFDQDKIAHDLVSAMTFKMPASKEEKQDGQAGTLNRASENNEAQDKRTSVIN